MNKIKQCCLVRYVFIILSIFSLSISACSPVPGEIDDSLKIPILDTIAPELTVLIPDASYTNNSYFCTVSGTASDQNLEGVYFSHNDSAFKRLLGTTAWSTNLNTLAEGSNILRVYARDTFNNESDIYRILVYVDTDVPIITLNPSARTTNMFFTLTLSVDAEYGYWSTNGLNDFHQFGLADATLDIVRNTSLLYYSRDILANTSSTQTVIYTVDTVRPLVSVDAMPALTNVSDLTFTVGGSDDNSSIASKYYRLDSGSGISFTGSTFTITGISEGSHNIHVWYIDNAGNSSLTNSKSIDIDTLAPVVISDYSSDLITNAVFSVTLSVNEDFGYWSTNGSGFTSYDYSGKVLDINSNTELKIFGDDGINTSVTQTIVYTLDFTIPDTPVFTGSSTTIDRTPVWDWNAVANATGYRYSYTDGSSWTETGSTYFIPGSDLSYGDHTLYVQARDAAGNWSLSASKTISIMSLFTEINPTSLSNADYSRLALGDINGDSSLDLILTGGFNNRFSQILTNDGAGLFTEINPGSLSELTGQSLALGDLNGDTYLDMIFTGLWGQYQAQIKTNDGTGTFTEINLGSLTGVDDGSSTLGDIDGDGDLDLILTGSPSSSRIAKIYQNNGSAGFTEINAGTLTGVDRSTVSLGDIDGDGDLDMILAGYYYDTSAHYITKIYRNNGSGAFTEINPGSLTGVRSGSSVLGDLDGDGDLDLLLSGYTGTSDVSKIYRNNGSGSFTEINPGSITTMNRGFISLGDLDGDGDLDFILTGYYYGGLCKIYLNNGNASFTEKDPGSLTPVLDSDSQLGDIDGDGDLDLIISGSYITKIYRNNLQN